MTVELRTPTLTDMNRHTKWTRDPIVAALDPPAGVVESPLFWSIYTDGVHIGSISVYNRVGLSAEMGILIGDPVNWNKGYGTKAIKRLLEMCGEAGFLEIHLKVLPDNDRAIRCYEKCGFDRAGYINIDGRPFLQMRIRT